MVTSPVISVPARARRGSAGTARWWIPAGLLLLTAVPAVAGAFRLTELAAGAQVTEENVRFFAAPVPVVVHIISAVVFCALGAFQFVNRRRRRRPAASARRRGWHRLAGRLLVPCGLAAALSGLWMTVFYSRPEGVGDLLTGFRLMFGSAMVGSLVLAVAAVRRRDFARHGAWMIRGYAIGQGAGTQVLTNLPWVLIVGPPGELAFALLMAAGWVINLAVAEWVIRRASSASSSPLAPLSAR